MKTISFPYSSEIIINNLVSILSVFHNFFEETYFCKVFDIENQFKKNISQPHINYREINKHGKIEIYVLPFFFDAWMFIEILSVGTQAKIIVILFKITACIRFGHMFKLNAFLD